MRGVCYLVFEICVSLAEMLWALYSSNKTKTEDGFLERIMNPLKKNKD